MPDGARQGARDFLPPVTRPWLCWFANAFVVGYAFDAGLSGFEEAFRWSTGSMGLLGVRNALALYVLLHAFCMLIALALTPRLPATILLPLSVSALWLGWSSRSA